MVVTLTPLLDIPMVLPGDDIAGLLIRACAQAAPADHDVLAVAQKIVSKAEGRYVDLAQVRPSPRAQRLAAEVNKDARLVEVILSESRRVGRYRPRGFIVGHRLRVIIAHTRVGPPKLDPPFGPEARRPPAPD